ncbi:MAG: DUF2070 family protein [Candidatus Micrarchaeota archaeon]
MVIISSEERAVKLTSYIGQIPSSHMTFMGLLAMGFLFGILTHIVLPVNWNDSYGFVLGLIERGGDGLFLISIPAMLSAITVTIIKSKLALRKSLFIALICSLVYVAFYSLALMGGVGPDVLFIGYGLTFVVWYVVARVFFNLHWYTAFLLSVVQLVYNVSFLLVGKMVFISNDPAAIIIKLYFSSFAFLAALYAVFWLIDAPMRRNFGVSGIEAISLFMAQWMNKTKELESMFESVGEEIETVVNIMAFKKKNGRDCLFVTPCVHFGPFGNLGGSEYPYLIAKQLGEEMNADVFVFHGTATHDFNPVATDELESLLAGCRTALEKMKYKDARGSIIIEKVKTCKATCIIANDNCFIGLTRAPRTTEDMEFALGMSIRYLAISMKMKDAVVVDSHNAETGEITRVYMGDPISFEYMDAVKHALGKKRRYETMKLGVCLKDMVGLADGSLGKGGLKTAVFRVGGDLFSIVLFDANGVVPGFRRRIIDAVRETGIKDCEVYTTDTHCVNAVRGVLNPLGSIEGEKFIKQVVDSVAMARKDLTDVEVGMRTERIRIKVFGTKQTSELLGTINSIVAVGRLAIPIVFLITVLFVLWGITKF